MNIRFKSIDIENFRSIEKAYVELENQGTVIVKGINEYEDKATSNGSGKSSLFEAIIYAIFEETSSGEKDVSNRITGQGYTITLKFDIDDIHYMIIRKCSGNKTNVMFYKNDTDITERNKTDTNKLIIDTFGISKAIFLDSIFLSQSANTNLASLSPTARKERLEILTNTDKTVNDFKDKLKEQQNKYETVCVENQMTINKLNGNKEACLKQQADIQLKINQIKLEMEQLKQLGDLKQIENDIKQKETVDLVNIEHLIEKLTEDIADKEKAVDELRVQGADNLKKKEDLEKQKQEKLDEYNRQKARQDAKKIEIHFSDQNIEKLNAQIKEIKNSDKCPTCGRKYEDANEEHIQQKIQELQVKISDEQVKINEANQEIQKLDEQMLEIETAGKQLTSEIIQVSADIEEHNKKVNDLDNERKDLVQQQQQAYASKNKCQLELNELNHKKEQLLKTQTNNIEEFKTMISNINKDIEEIDKQIENYQNLYNTNDDFVSVTKNSIQMVTKEFRTYLLQNSLQYLNKLLADYSKQLFSNVNDVISIVGDDTKLNIRLGNATYESLSGGEKTRVNIALLLAQKSLANTIGNISCNMIILDEILGYCDSQAEENVINLITQELETLESIYMVSHKELPIGYDLQLTVLKDKNGLSRIITR